MPQDKPNPEHGFIYTFFMPKCYIRQSSDHKHSISSMCEEVDEMSEWSEVRNSELGRVVPCRHCCLMSSWKWCSKKQKRQHNGNQQNNSTQHIRLRRTDWRMWVRQYRGQHRQDRRREESRYSKGAEDDRKVENDGDNCKFCEEQEAEFCEWQQLRMFF